MKKLITATLATLMTGQVFASNFTCEPQYEAKIKKLDHSLGNNIIPTAQVLGSVAVPTGMSVLGVSLIAAGPAFVVIAASMFARLIWLDNKYSSLLFAEAVIIESVAGKKLILKVAEEKYLWQQNEYAQRALRDINVRRAELGMPEVSFEDYIKVHPIPAFDPSTVLFATDRLVERMNLKEPGKYTFESVSASIKELSDGDTFCPGGKPRGIKQLTNIIKDHI